MKYLQKSFQVPAASPGTDDDRWAQAFGFKTYKEYEVHRQTLVLAERVKAAKAEAVKEFDIKCGGGTPGAISCPVPALDYLKTVETVKEVVTQATRIPAEVLKKGSPRR